ncbi:unnamed protein product, partial [Urochloa humidicola]
MASTATERNVLEKKLHDPTASPIFLPLQFLKDITCNFSTAREIGRGGYGVVYKGLLWSGKIVAVKKIYDIHLVEDDKFQREATYLMGIKHQNIVQLVGYCAESRWEAIELGSGSYGMAELPKRLLYFEYICNGSLDMYVTVESSGLDWCKRFEIIKGICGGLHFLHEKHIVHLDLKPKNILMNTTMIPKIADFGLSRLLGAEKSRTILKENVAGTWAYMAPEYSSQGIVSTKADIFSFGVIIIEIITGGKDRPLICSVPYLQLVNSRESIETHIQHYIENVLGRWENRFRTELKYTSTEVYIQQVKECITIALRCVDYDSSRRPNAREIFMMLSAVESTKFRAQHVRDSVVYQVQDEPQIGLPRSPGYMERLPAEKPPMWKLVLQTPPLLPIFTGSNIGPLKIILVDADTGTPVALQQVLHLEVIVLDGNFRPGNYKSWTQEKFEKHIVKGREGKRQLLRGCVRLTMRDGRALVGKLYFTDNSSWVHSGMFRIGARVVPRS